jgi:carbon-monoxide dehydrogenase small subunit
MQLTVNGQLRELPDAEAPRRLLDVLRETLDLTGAKDGCGIGVCGACTVLLDGAPVKACRLSLGDVAGRALLTIEGLEGPDGTLHPLQQAFLDAGAIQCGFCTPAMVLTAHAFLRGHPRPSRPEIRRALAPVLCRCTGYQQIVDAVERAAPFYA